MNAHTIYTGADAELPTATLHEASGRLGSLPSAIKPIDPSWRICGVAVTVSTVPGENLRLHEALCRAERGDVLVVDVSDGQEFGYWGEIMTVAAQTRGLGGLVINGGVRDRDGILALGFPIFAERICIRGTAKAEGLGSINHPITIGDVTIRPGDLVVGDADGVVVVERARIDEVLAAAHQREQRELILLQDARDGVRTLDFI